MNKRMLLLIVLFAAIIFIGYGAWEVLVPKDQIGSNQIACTQEAKQCPDGSYVSRTGPNCEFTQCPATPAMKTYTDSANGFSFQYPEKPSSDYINFAQAPDAIVSKEGDKNIASDGCYILNLPPSGKPDSHVILNGLNFCLSQGSEGAAGHAYESFYFTTPKNGYYYTLRFIVSEVNCGVYGDTTSAKYQQCESDRNNKDNIVIKPIQQSVATLTFTK